MMRDVRTLAVTDRGQPFVTEHRLGRGRAILVHCYSPQGQGNYRELAEDIFHAVGRAELAPFRVEPDARVSYALYGKGAKQSLYLLNTERERSVGATIGVAWRAGAQPASSAATAVHATNLRRVFLHILLLLCDVVSGDQITASIPLHAGMEEKVQLDSGGENGG